MTEKPCPVLDALLKTLNQASENVATLAEYAEIVVTLPALRGERLPAESIEAIRESIRRLLSRSVAPAVKAILLVNPSEVPLQVSVFLLITDATAAEEAYHAEIRRLTPDLRLASPITITPIGDTPTRTLTDAAVTHRVDLHLREHHQEEVTVG